MNNSLVNALKSKFGKARLVGEWVHFNCPTCSNHDRPKMKRTIHIRGSNSRCWICGIEKSIMELLNDGDTTYIHHFSDEPYDDTEPKVIDPRCRILPCTTSIPINKLPSNHLAVQFLNKDYLTDLDTYANLHKIVYVPYEGGIVLHNGSHFITSAERIIFPVYFNNEMVGWQMRSVPGTFYDADHKDFNGNVIEGIRYYHLFSKGSYLYNYDQARQFDRVIVVEGVKKALKFPNGVATWGSCLSRQQLKLVQTWKEVVMLLDSDLGNNTQEKAKKFVDGINSNPQCKAINIDLAKYGHSSPDDLPSSVLNLIVEEEWQLQHKQIKN